MTCSQIKVYYVVKLCDKIYLEAMEMTSLVSSLGQN